jgi:hypothetical protein
VTPEERTREIVEFLRENDCPYSAAIVETHFGHWSPDLGEEAPPYSIDNAEQGQGRDT